MSETEWITVSTIDEWKALVEAVRENRVQFNRHTLTLELQAPSEADDE